MLTCGSSCIGTISLNSLSQVTTSCATGYGSKETWQKVCHFLFPEEPFGAVLVDANVHHIEYNTGLRAKRDTGSGDNTSCM